MEKKQAFRQINLNILNDFISGKLSSTAMRVYLLFIERASFSKFKDEEDKTYFIVTYEEITKKTNITNRATISKTIKELENNKLICKKKTFTYTKYYLK